MTDQTRAKKGRRKRRSASQLFLAALIVFGIVASVLLLFSESVQWMRVGVLSALWAAVIGAFAMTKYRREAAADQTKAKDLQTVYELQLAREISARREYEMSVEARVRNETRLESDEVAALRNELAALRQNLQVLFEGNLPTERVALRAEAMRMQELGGRGYDSYQPAPSGLYVRGGGDGNGPGFNGMGTPYDEPVTAETSVVYPEDPDEMPRATAAPETSTGYVQDEYAEQKPAPEGSGYDDVTDAGQDDRVEPPAAQARPYGAPRPAGRVNPPTSPFTAYNFEQTRRPGAESEPVEQAVPVEQAEQAVPIEQDRPQPIAETGSVEDADTYGESRRSLRDSADAFFAADRVEDTPAEEPVEAPRRGRRRAESTEETSGAHSNGRSVAEIMAGLSGGDSSDTTTTDAGTRRRRRRAD